MGKFLQLIFGGLISGGLRKLLMGAGIGLATAALSLTIINYYMDKITQSSNGIGVVASILGIAGFDVALSIIFSAIVLKITINSTKLFLSKAGT